MYNIINWLKNNSRTTWPAVLLETSATGWKWGGKLRLQMMVHFFYMDLYHINI